MIYKDMTILIHMRIPLDNKLIFYSYIRQNTARAGSIAPNLFKLTLFRSVGYMKLLLISDIGNCWILLHQSVTMVYGLCNMSKHRLDKQTTQTTTELFRYTIKLSISSQSTSSNIHQHTHITHQAYYLPLLPNITFCSPNLTPMTSWRTVETLGSDHFPVGITTK